MSAVPARAASFAEFDRRAGAGERLTVVYFGASLTWGANATDPNRTSWRALVSRKLEERYPEAHFRFVDAAIGGTGSQLGVFRLERDVLAHRPDLVFLDFTANDTITTADKPTLASYEAIVRRVVAEAGAPLVQVVLPFKWDLKTPREQLARLAAHRQLSEAYGAAFADAVSLLKDRMKSGAVNPDDLWPADPVHPGDAGYAQFAEAVWTAFDQAVAEKRVCRPPAEPVHGDLFLHSRRARLADLGPLPAGWRRERPHVQASNYDMLMSRWLDSVAVAGGSTNVAPLRLEFRGRFVMLFGEGTVKTGKLRALLDGQPVTYPVRRLQNPSLRNGSAQPRPPNDGIAVDSLMEGEPVVSRKGVLQEPLVKKQPETLFDPGSLAHKIKGTTHLVQVLIADAAPDTYHTLELIPVLASPDEELRIESVCVAGPGADVRVVRSKE